MSFPFLSPPVAPDVRMSSKDLDGLRFSHAAAQCTPEKIHQVIPVVHVGQNHHSILGRWKQGPAIYACSQTQYELLGIFHIYIYIYNCILLRVCIYIYILLNLVMHIYIYIYTYTAYAWALPGPAMTTGDASSSSSSSSSSELNPFWRSSVNVEV